MIALTYQKDNYSCGAHALANGLRLSGINADLDSVIAAAHTTPRHGTGIAGLIAGARQFGLRPVQYRQHNADIAFRWLIHWTAKYPVILLVDGCLRDDHNTHWIVSTQWDDRLVVIDSSIDTRRGHNGVFFPDKQEILSRWKQRLCFAIRLQP